MLENNMKRSTVVIMTKPNIFQVVCSFLHSRLSCTKQAKPEQRGHLMLSPPSRRLDINAPPSRTLGD